MSVLWLKFVLTFHCLNRLFFNMSLDHCNVFFTLGQSNFWNKIPFLVQSSIFWALHEFLVKLWGINFKRFWGQCTVWLVKYLSMLPLGFLRQNRESSSSFISALFCGDCLHLGLFFCGHLVFFPSINAYFKKNQ